MPKKKKNYGKHETIDEKVKRRKREEKERQKRLERIEKKNRKNAKHSLSNTQYEDDIDTVIKMSNRHNHPNATSMQSQQNYLDNSDLQDSYKFKKSNGSGNSKNFKNSRGSNGSSSSYDPRNSKKGKNRNQKSGSGKKVIAFVIILLFIVGICAFALTSPIFNIKDIQVINNNKISSDTILSLSTLKKGENIFKFYDKNVENHIKEEPYVASATIHRKLPDIVQIDVTERSAQFAIEYMEKYVYIDNQGYILELNADDKQSLPIIKGISLDQENVTPGNRLGNDNLDKLEAVIEIIASMKESKLDEKVTSIDVTTKNNYSVYLESEKKTVHLGDTSNLSNKILYVQAIIEQEKDNEGDIFVNGDLNEGFDPYFRSKV